jgi:hypothetical protein
MGSQINKLYSNEMYFLMEHEKCCTACGESKTLSCFGPNRRMADGLHYVCKPCKKQRDEEYRQRKREKNAAVEWRNLIDWTGTKRCTRCKEELPKTSFGPDHRLKDYLSIYCKACTFKDQQPRKRKLHQYLWEKREQSNGCVDCGCKDPRLLQFDHVRGSKKQAVTTLSSTRTIDEELLKTDMRCVMCHRYKSVKEGPKPSSTAVARHRNRERVRSVKFQIGGCQNCGLKIEKDDEFHHSCFDFDHLDRSTKKEKVSNLMARGASVATLDEEIAKCQLLCAACHWLKTGKELGWHGYE